MSVDRVGRSVCGELGERPHTRSIDACLPHLTTGRIRLYGAGPVRGRRGHSGPPVVAVGLDKAELVWSKPGRRTVFTLKTAGELFLLVNGAISLTHISLVT